MNLEFEAADPKAGATISEVSQWFTRLNTLGFDPRTPIQAVVGFRGQLQKIKAKDIQS